MFVFIISFGCHVSPQQVGTVDHDYEILNTQPLYATVRTDPNTQPLYATVRTDLNTQPLYATVRTDHRKKKIEETLKEDDYYEVVQQVREVMVVVVLHLSFLFVSVQ